MMKNKFVDFDPIFNKIIETGRMMRAHYICYSVEDCTLESSDIKSVFEDDLVDSTKVNLDRDSKKGGIHIHVYMECSRTIRWSTVINKWANQGFGKVHTEVRTGWRETCREYHMGIKNYQEKPSFIISGEWGKWREDLGDSYSKEDYFELAAGMIIHGYNPAQVARRFPSWYIRHGYGVRRLWEDVNREFEYS